MTDHADTIRRRLLDGLAVSDPNIIEQANHALAALDALLAEKQQLLDEVEAWHAKSIEETQARRQAEQRAVADRARTTEGVDVTDDDELRMEDAVAKHQPLSDYERGVVHGLYAHSWMKDGATYVGTGIYTLGQAIDHQISEHRRLAAGDPERRTP